jgi:hypothetical protein
MSDFGKGFSICAQVHAGVLRRVPPAFCQLVTQCVTNWHYRAFLRLATQRVTFLSALPLGWRHGALGKFILICPGRIIGPCSRSSAETRAISKGASVAAVGEETPNRFRHRRRLSFRGIGGHDL